MFLWWRGVALEKKHEERKPGRDTRMAADRKGRKPGRDTRTAADRKGRPRGGHSNFIKACLFCLFDRFFCLKQIIFIFQYHKAHTSHTVVWPTPGPGLSAKQIAMAKKNGCEISLGRFGRVRGVWYLNLVGFRAYKRAVGS